MRGSYAVQIFIINPFHSSKRFFYFISAGRLWPGLARCYDNRPLGGTNTDYCGSIFYGLAACGWKIWRLTLELNGLTEGHLPSNNPVVLYLDRVAKSDLQSRALQAGSLRLELTDRIVTVRHIANALIFLGLIGTVIGFIIALSAVDPNAASDAENVAGVIATLIDGMSVALNTTLVGATLYLWLTVNYRILTSGTVTLIAEVIGPESDVHQLDELDEDNWVPFFAMLSFSL